MFTQGTLHILIDAQKIKPSKIYLPSLDKNISNMRPISLPARFLPYPSVEAGTQILTFESHHYLFWPKLVSDRSKCDGQCHGQGK